MNCSSKGDRVIDVGSEWRTFTNEKATKDPSRVGDAQNPLLNGGDLTTMISKVPPWDGLPTQRHTQKHAHKLGSSQSVECNEKSC